MKLIFFFLIILLVTSNFGFTGNQIDTLGILSYFPMHVGDQWQYSATNTVDTSYYTVTITDYIEMPNNKYYYEFDKGNSFDYFRIDTSDFKVYQYDPIMWGADSEYVYFSLTFPDTGMPPSYYWLADTIFGQVGFLPIYRNQNLYFWTDFSRDEEKYLSQDFGISSEVDNWGWGSIVFTDLIAAQIDSVIYGQFITSVEQTEKFYSFKLHQNYPNPFNQMTTIKFSLEKLENVTIEVFNLLGQKIESLLKKQLSAGSHQVEFNAKDLASGIYYYRFEAGEYQALKKMILLK